MEEMMNVAIENGEAAAEAVSEVATKASPKTLFVIGGCAAGITLAYFATKAIVKKVEEKKAKKEKSKTDNGTEKGEKAEKKVTRTRRKKEAVVEPEVAD